MTVRDRIPLSSPDITESDIQAVTDVLLTPHLSLGPKLGAFEDAVAQYAGVRHAVATSSGTSALHLAVRALRLRPGDEVITTPFSFVASANVLLYEDLVPVFVDVDPITLNIDPRRIEGALSARTRAILVVHVFGRPCEMPAIETIAARAGLVLLEDACEAIGAESNGRRVGSIGSAGAFAFYPNKQMTTGEGGVLVSNDAHIAELARRMRNQGRDVGAEWFDHVELGFNYRLSDLNSALGLSQLSRLDAMLASRARVASGYHERLRDDQRVTLPALDDGASRVSWFVFTVQLSDRYERSHRDEIVSRMREVGIGCGRYFHQSTYSRTTRRGSARGVVIFPLRRRRRTGVSPSRSSTASETTSWTKCAIGSKGFSILWTCGSGRVAELVQQMPVRYSAAALAGRIIDDESLVHEEAGAGEQVLDLAGREYVPAEADGDIAGGKVGHDVSVARRRSREVVRETSEGSNAAVGARVVSVAHVDEGAPRGGHVTSQAAQRK